MPLWLQALPLLLLNSPLLVPVVHWEALLAAVETAALAAAAVALALVAEAAS
jgi:hypothetical protein